MKRKVTYLYLNDFHMVPDAACCAFPLSLGVTFVTFLGILLLYGSARSRIESYESCLHLTLLDKTYKGNSAIDVLGSHIRNE